MGILDRVVKGPKTVPYYLLVYGPEGVGKTSFACTFPRALCIDLEHKADELAVERVQLDTAEEVFQLLQEMVKDSHGYETIVLDTLDTFCRMLAASIQRRKFGNSEAKFQDFGRGVASMERSIDRVFLPLLEQLHKKGLHIVLVAHASVQKDPQTDGTLERWFPRLNPKYGELFRERVHQGFFIHRESHTEKKRRGRGYFGKTFLKTEGGDIHWAKNGIGLPATIPFDRNLGFAEVDSLRSQNKESFADEFEEVLSGYTPEEAQKIRAYVGRFADCNEGMRYWLERRRLQIEEAENA